MQNKMFDESIVVNNIVHLCHLDNISNCTKICTEKENCNILLVIKSVMIVGETYPCKKN